MSSEIKEKQGDAQKPMKLQLSKTLDASRLKQGVGTSARATKAVTVEVRRARGAGGSAVVEVKRRPGASADADSRFTGGLSNDEHQARLHALKAAEEETKRREIEEAKRKEEDARIAIEREERRKREAEEMAQLAGIGAEKSAPMEEQPPVSEKEIVVTPSETVVEEDAAAKRPAVKPAVKFAANEEDSDKNKAKIRLKQDEPRRGRLTITKALDFEEERVRSLASVKRQREKAKRHEIRAEQDKVFREVILPETITVQELANRMTERVVDVVKSLMKLGTMATAAHIIDADTAELIATEFGHTVKRVTEGDVENVLIDAVEDADALLLPRPPVVTVMGHVDHGKTSLLDALRKTDVVTGEAGGITQHIGAYQISMNNGQKITFLDTPGHEAFTAMRSRGAKVTDIVVLVVAADDGVREQTVEALNHARAAGVPMIIAINKIDKPGADGTRVRTELMQYEIVTEDMGGDTMAIEVSAKTGHGLASLEEAILLQAEVMELRANPNRAANGAVIEAKVDKGRGVVASVLIQRGTLRIGDLVVAGGAFGRVRAINDDKGQALECALPAQPVEILGLNIAPDAGDEFAVVESERIARDITEYRQNKSRAQRSAANAPTLDQLFNAASKQRIREFPVIIKGDVQGSVEAIIGSITKFISDEVKVRVLHSGVGAVNESDISLASASKAMVIAFNVRANAQAKENAHREAVGLRYYSVIYDIVDDVKAALSGMLSPDKRENIIGYARIDQVFSVTKVGRVAGCIVTEGMIKRGCHVRLLRDNIVIHTGALKTLKRFKDEVKEVKNGFECGMAFENYDDIRESDMIEAYEVEQIARSL